MDISRQYWVNEMCKLRELISFTENIIRSTNLLDSFDMIYYDGQAVVRWRQHSIIA